MIRLPFVLTIAAAILARSASADTLESVEKKIAERSKSVTSLTAVMKAVIHANGPGYKSRSVMEGSYEYAVKADNTLYRSETTTTTHTEAAGQTTTMKATTLAISDGQYACSLTEANGQKTATRTRMVKTPADPFSSYRGTHKLRLLPDETLNGQPTWVIEAVPKTLSSPTSKERTVVWFDQGTGWMVKTVSYDATGTPATTMTYTNLKTGVPIKENRFEFKAPPGVTVMDITGKP